MKRLALVLLCACGADPLPPPSRSVPAGGTVSLLDVAREALACAGPLAWSVVEEDGGSVTASGEYSPPACRPGGIEGTYHVEASGCGRSAVIAVSVAEDVVAVEIVCGVRQGETCCHRPPLSVPAGQTIQLYAAVRFTCPEHVEYSPAPPPEACP